MSEAAKAELTPQPDERLITDLDQPLENGATSPSADELFYLYEEVIEHQPSTRDAEIFEKVRQWTFSDFSAPAHTFAGISKSELDSWQMRNRINLSAGHIRPDPIDLQRGYAWGHMRMAAAVNRLHSDRPPPSASEVRDALPQGSAR